MIRTKLLITIFLLSSFLLVSTADIDSLDLDYSSTITLYSAASPLVLIRPYTCKQDKQGRCVGTPDYGGVKTEHGKWTTQPSPFLDYLNPVSGVLEDTLGFAGSQATLTYNVLLGDAKQAIDSKLWIQNSTKTMGQVTFDFQCGWTDDNYMKIEPQVLYNPATAGRTWHPPLDKQSPIFQLKFGQFFYSSEVAGKVYYQTIPSSGHPIKVSAYFEASNPSLSELWMAWVKTAFLSNSNDVKEEIFYLVLPGFTEGLDLDFNYKKVNVANFTSWVLDCSLPKNQDACNFRVLDDVDFNYNSLMWALGQTSGNRIEYSTMSAAGTLLEQNGFKKMASCYKNNVFDTDAIVVVFCNIDSTGNCKKLVSGREVTHVAYYYKEIGAWTSKFNFGPLIMHDSPLDIKGLGKMKVCYNRGKNETI